MNQTIKLIIADDHPVFRDGLYGVLKRQDFISKISQASDGTEVIRFLESENYDVVLMDIKMLPMNGVQATEIIRNRFPEVKIIALSMFGEERFINEMITKGASGYLLKNSNKSEIVQAIKSVVRGNSYFSEEVAEFIVDKLNGKSNIEKENTAFMGERLREIIFLICHEKTSKEIAAMMKISHRTIDDCRGEIMKLTNSKSTIGVLKFAIQNGIMDDVLLKGKYGL
ncbi:MAG: response regulator transcription factor [Bacteroidia bacterium]|jgi:DNA-binding NarL/FixJ family response regulator|nr:response regulator transcription factor [Bacteroidota bacterium]MBK7431621.1 response regulator transcription factor [Bacteroidota bacterium]MBK7572869.1 response regulator transcription factor [Bacteroidota bacterium]MBP9790119.1 response regulator transcription factor [Bacteroidia bacterium]MBP9923509.1 response regulator transcription factor [Bacteroidia bacterium]